MADSLPKDGNPHETALDQAEVSLKIAFITGSSTFVIQSTRVIMWIILTIIDLFEIWPPLISINLFL